MNLCHNCARQGHHFSTCRRPILSYGIVPFRVTDKIEYLMICRRNTLGYIDFLRGKYRVEDKPYIICMMKQMTDDEKVNLLTYSFDALWKNLWCCRPFEKDDLYTSATRPRTKPRPRPRLKLRQKERKSRRHWTDLNREEESRDRCGDWCESVSVSNDTSEAITSEVDLSGEAHTSVVDTFGEAQTSVVDTIGEAQTSEVDTSEGEGEGAASARRDKKTELYYSREKFNLLKTTCPKDSDVREDNVLQSLIAESNQYSTWTVPEWGFPKGRRNFGETNYDCALREAEEETGYPQSHMFPIKSMFPYHEIFRGSNYKTYKHVYYLTYINRESDTEFKSRAFDKGEVGDMQWKSFEQCMADIRPYNVEKKQMLTEINNSILALNILA